MAIDVSIIITTKNEEEHITHCLESIQAQAYPQERLEVIVVDNHSTDGTVDLARTYTPQVYTYGPERSAQRNYGIIEKACGTYAMYIDADMILSPQVVAACMSTMTSNPHLVGLYISEVVMGDSFWSRVRRFERSFYDGTVIDCMRFFRRVTGIATGGFDIGLTGPEDWDFDKKLRQRGETALIPEPIYHNEAHFSFRKYVSKKKYYAKSFSAYIEKWGADDADVKKQFGVSYRFIGVFTERQKWRKVIAHPILTLGMYILRFSVGVSYLLSS